MYHNPSLREELRYEPAGVIPLLHEASLLEWLERNGRLQDRDDDETVSLIDDSEEEISDLMGTDDSYSEEDEWGESEEPI